MNCVVADRKPRSQAARSARIWMSRYVPAENILRRVAVGLVIAVLAAFSSVSSAPAAGGSSTFTANAASGAVGSLVSVKAVDGCPAPAGAAAWTTIVNFSQGSNAQVSFVDLSVAADGSWSGSIRVPTGATLGAAQLTATCFDPSHVSQTQVVYSPVAFTVVASSFSANVASGAVGSLVSVRSVDGCAAPAGAAAWTTIVNFSQGSNAQVNFVDLSVAADGSWSGSIRVPTGATSGAAQLTATCFDASHVSQTQVVYSPASFNVTTVVPSVTSVSSSANPSVAGRAVTFTTNVTTQTPGAAAPSGLVTFSITPTGGGSVGCVAGNVQPLAAGSASCTVAGGLLASGSPYSVHVSYSGDSADRASATTPDLVQRVVDPAYSQSLDHFSRTVGTNNFGNPERFWIDGDVVMHSFLTSGSFSAPSSLGGPPTGIRSLEVGNDLNYLDNAELYVVANDGQVWHDYATPGQGSGWSGWYPMGAPGPISGQVVVGRNYLDNQELYVLSNGQAFHSYSTPGQGTGWSRWSPLGAPSPGVAAGSDVHVSRNSFDNQELYLSAVDGQVWHSYSTPGVGSGWSAWAPLGGPPSPAGDMVVWRNWLSNQELFRIAGGTVWHDWATPGVGSGWAGWFPLSAPAGVTLTGWIGLDAAAPLGTLSVWVMDTAGRFWSTSLDPNDSWTVWSQVTPVP